MEADEAVEAGDVTGRDELLLEREVSPWACSAAMRMSQPSIVANAAPPRLLPLNGTDQAVAAVRLGADVAMLAPWAAGCG